MITSSPPEHQKQIFFFLISDDPIKKEGSKVPYVADKLHQIFKKDSHYFEMLKYLTVFFLKYKMAFDKLKDQANFKKITEKVKKDDHLELDARDPMDFTFEQMTYLFFDHTNPEVLKGDNLKNAFEVFHYFGENSNRLFGVTGFNNFETVPPHGPK